MISLYIARLPDDISGGSLLSDERQTAIDRISNERVKREKYYVWRLLEYAIKNTLGADASRLCFTKNENGKWMCEDFEFSLSHSGNALAVAVSNNAVGVDIERIRVKRREGLAEYILTQNEKKAYLNSDDKDAYLIRKWCEKEAIFKSLNENTFRPNKIESAEFYCEVHEYCICDEQYIVSVAAKQIDTVKIFYDVEL